MNAEEVMLLFQEYDDPIRWNYPIGFDYQHAITRFHDFREALDKATGIRHLFETGGMIQDASFHSEINLGVGWLRFSNFGNMVSISPDHEVDEQTLAIIEDICDQKGYFFIPTQFTERPYTGKNSGVTGIPDWWIRYFDWV